MVNSLALAVCHWQANRLMDKVFSLCWFIAEESGLRDFPEPICCWWWKYGCLFFFAVVVVVVFVFKFFISLLLSETSRVSADPNGASGFICQQSEQQQRSRSRHLGRNASLIPFAWIQKTAIVAGKWHWPSSQQIRYVYLEVLQITEQTSIIYIRRDR